MAAKHLIYQVSVGDTPGFYCDCIESVSRYARRIGATHIVQREPILRVAPTGPGRSANALRLGYLPIYEKENAFSYLDEFDKVLILDADVFVTDKAPDIFLESDAPFSGVVEREMPLTPRYFEKIRKYSKGQYEKLSDVDWRWNDDGAEFFNMGVMLLDASIKPYLDGQTPKEFLRRPEFARFVNGEGHWRWSTDQTLLNWWLKSAGIEVAHLDWRWNALYGAVMDVSEAHFVHFFLSDKLPKRGMEIPKIIGRLCNHDYRP